MISILFYKFLTTITFNLFLAYESKNGGKGNDILEVSKHLNNIDMYSNKNAPEICYGLNQSEIDLTVLEMFEY